MKLLPDKNFYFPRNGVGIFQPVVIDTFDFLYSHDIHRILPPLLFFSNYSVVYRVSPINDRLSDYGTSPRRGDKRSFTQKSLPLLNSYVF